MRRRITPRPIHEVRPHRRADTSWLVFLIPLLLLVVLGGAAMEYGFSFGGADSQAALTDDAGTSEAAPVATTHAEIRQWSPPIALQYFKGNDVTPEFMAENINWLSMQYGMEDERQAVLERGYRGPILQYMLTFQIRGPGPYKNERDKCKNNYTPIPDNPMWTDDFCELVHSHESWFLHNGKGERLYNKEKNWDGTDIYEYYMNPASQGYRDFWVAQMKRQKDAGWQGFILDNVPVSFDYLRTRADNQDGKVKELNSGTELRQAVVGLIGTIRRTFPEHPIWGNMIKAGYNAKEWDDYIDHLDGFQEENFATGWTNSAPPSAKEWDGMVRRAEKALARGKHVLLFGQGDQDDRDQLAFSLASFLLVAPADGRATFRYTHTEAYKSLWWYPEYTTNLGLPKSNRYREGKYWQRDFQCARVIVDPAARTGSIQMRPCKP